VSGPTTSSSIAVPNAAAAAAPGSIALPHSLIAREAELGALVQMITARGFRAGLLHGELGVGKTSLLRAGLVPYLLDQGMIALYCGDMRRPLPALVHAVQALTNLAPEQGETPILFIDRVVTRVITDKQVVLVLDHMEDALLAGDEALLADLGDLFARVVTRSGGRGKFLFCCDSAHVHRFGLLEQRTGSLFPPTSRFELGRLDVERARAVLAHILQRRRLAAAPSLVDAVVQALAREAPVLPADLETAAVALSALRATSPADLQRLGSGGPVDVLEALQQGWIETGAKATGKRNAALGMMGELAATPRPVPRTASWLAARLGMAPEDAFAVLDQLHLQGLVEHTPPPPESAGEPGFVLAHPGLRLAVREVAAPALASARRLRDMLTARVERGQRLTPREYARLRAARFVPATSQERATLERTKRTYTIAAGVTVGLPLLLLIIVYVSMSGRYYFDVAVDGGAAGRGGPHLVVRAGRPGLSGFDWLPASPGFGSVIADPGLSRPMVRDAFWQAAASHEIGGDTDGDAYAATALDAMDPAVAALIAYAIDGSTESLAALQKHAPGPQELTALLEALAPIARGTPEEIAFIEQALNDSSPLVQAAALGVAAHAARRQPERYRATLARALANADADLRRLAFAAVRELEDADAQLTFQAALTQNPDAAARRELLAAITALEATTMPSAKTAASILLNRDIPAATRQAAREALRRAFTTTPGEAAQAAAGLASDDQALPEDQVWALQLMRDLAPKDSYAAIADGVRKALSSQAEPVRLAALAVYARVAPRDAAAELANLRKNEPNPSEALRIAMARAWGEVAKIPEPAAALPLQELLDDESAAVRVVAAEAYGNVGRDAVPALEDLAKKARFDVAEGAVLGLANATDAGAPRNLAWSGITGMWRRKGRPRWSAGEAFARMAANHARHTYSYLTTAARTSDDARLREIGARGLCRASVAGHEPSRAMLARSSADESADVRRVVGQCVADNALDVETTTTIAVRLSYDGDAAIRADAARALVRVVEKGKVPEPVAKAVLRLVGDRERDVRTLSLRALAAMGAQAPAETGQALLRAYERGGEDDEKLELLATARAIGSGELVAPAITDRGAAVRIAALDTALAVATTDATGVATAMNAALTDSDPAVRRAALERIAGSAEHIEREALLTSLRLAVRDLDPGIARLGLTTLVRLGDTEEVVSRLRDALDERSEGNRTQAAAAVIGLVERDAKAALALLEPLLGDASHDVRRAMLPALAAAYAATRQPKDLADLLLESERHATRRLAVTAAFVVIARNAEQRDAAVAALAGVATDEDAPPMARLSARLGSGLIEGGADGLAFLTLLVP
jgi:HEAT repeat protein